MGAWVLAACCSGVLAASAQAGVIDAAELAEVRQINGYRRAHGLTPLRIDLRLTNAATWMSTDMGSANRFSHTDSRGRSPFERIARYRYPSDTWRGENLAAGNVEPRATFEQWRSSPAHNANMLNHRYRAIGISRVRNANATYGWYWTTTFGSRVVAPI